MLITTFGSALQGINAVTISIEVNWLLTGKSTSIVGLPDSAVRESLERIESAYKTNGFRFPRTKLVINLAPADQRKSGTAFDLPIALGILGASGQLNNSRQLSDYVIMGELALDGTIRPVKGALPIAIRARQDNFKGLILPIENLQEASLVEGLAVWGARHLYDLVTFFSGQDHALSLGKNIKWQDCAELLQATHEDLNEVRGQEQAKRALEIAAAGGHHMILIGTPGSGKTLLAKKLPTILPLMTPNEALETTQIYSAAGRLANKPSLLLSRPFRHPHHSISDKGLIGGGSPPQAGEISLAHHGVLFLDELPEFNRNALEALRQPLEERKIVIARMGHSYEYPASFMLVAAMNPCPCGYKDHPERECNCSPGAVQRYMNRISGPLMDRIDLQVAVRPVPVKNLTEPLSAPNSAAIRKKVEMARQVQLARLSTQPGIFCNAQLSGSLLRDHCSIDNPGKKLLERAMEKLKLSARAHDRLLKLARTIADLEGCSAIGLEHLAEAIQYRSLDRQNPSGTAW